MSQDVYLTRDFFHKLHDEFEQLKKDIKENGLKIEGLKEVNIFKNLNPFSQEVHIIIYDYIPIMLWEKLQDSNKNQFWKILRKMTQSRNPVIIKDKDIEKIYTIIFE